MLASNPLRNNRSETHRNDEGATIASPLFLPHYDRFPMPQKTQSSNLRKTSGCESQSQPKKPQRVQSTTYWGYPLQTREDLKFICAAST